MTKRRAAKPSAQTLKRELEIAQGNLSALVETRRLDEKARHYAADMATIQKFVDAVGAAGIPSNVMIAGGYLDSDRAHHFATPFGALIELANLLRRHLPL